MSTTEEPPVVAQSARPRSANAWARAPESRSAATLAAPAGVSTIGRSGSVARSETAGLAWLLADDGRSRSQRADRDGIAAAGLDRLRQQVDVRSSRCAEVPIPGLHPILPDPDV